jgi:hypothetical protein
MSFIDSEVEDAETKATKKPNLRCDHSSHAGQTYVADDPVVMNEHLADGKHTEGGSGACAICGKENISANHAKIGRKPICDDCRGDLAAA